MNRTILERMRLLLDDVEKFLLGQLVFRLADSELKPDVKGIVERVQGLKKQLNEEKGE